MLKTCAIITSHNRKTTTLKCLRQLEASAKIANIRMNAVLVDDGSTDGTADAVQENFNWVRVIIANGDLFWTRSMHVGLSEASKHDVDAYLLVNDDTLIVDDAINIMINTWKKIEKKTGKPVVVVGSTADKKTGKITYGGSLAKSKFRRFTFNKVWDEFIPVECHVANGNFLLIPRAIISKVGNLDFAFEHAFGDIDYSLRVGKAGFPVYVAPGVIGYCSHNPVAGTFNDKSLSFTSRWKAMLSRKGLPWRSWYVFTKKHGGFFWLVYFLNPYISLVTNHFISSLGHYVKTESFSKKRKE